MRFQGSEIDEMSIVRGGATMTKKDMKGVQNEEKNISDSGDYLCSHTEQPGLFIYIRELVT